MPAESAPPSGLLYHPEHDWAKVDGDIATFGITWYAQDQLGDIVFWDKPAIGRKVRAGDPYTELESVKAVSDVIAPLSGEIIEVNHALDEHPALINEAPYREGWLVRVSLTAPAECLSLLSSVAYGELLAS